MTRAISRISFHQLKKISLPDRKQLKDFIIFKVRSEGLRLASVDFVFCDDKYLHAINKQFLNHDELTDIVTFDLSEEKNVIVSEIYISVDRVTDNASHFEVPVVNELCRVMFHGILHLCGYNDKTEEELSEMRVKEAEWLTEYLI